jgi:hypothetical protein
MSYHGVVAISTVPRTTRVEAAPAQSGLSVAARHARPFEPTGLGPLYPAFAALLHKITNKRQSEILRIVQREKDGREDDDSSEALAYRLALSVLADYIAFGNYPIVSGSRCYLVPVLESENIAPEKRRRLAQRLFCLARDRAMADRNQIPWLRAATAALDDEAYDPRAVIRHIASAPPDFQLLEARNANRTLDNRGLWRAARATWSMGVESSAPGREVAFLGVDAIDPRVPLGILQFRNVVPEIVARDRWLGISAAIDSAGKPQGYLRYLTGDDAVDRLQATQAVIRSLLEHVNLDGLPPNLAAQSDPRALIEFATLQRAVFNDLRRQGEKAARSNLMLVKRAETAADLTRGVQAIATAVATGDPLAALSVDPELLRNLNAGLRKIWHYHMGFVAIELSVCGAAPPFGPLRIGKLMAAAAGSSVVIDAWGADRPLGEIAADTFRPSVREAVPNPGALVVFTSGLYPGHAAQYNRVRVGTSRWRKIGETLGYGSFHVSLETSRLAGKYNASVDGYRHITRSFGEGASPRFREVGRAISRLELPDLLRHEFPRPLYALPLVDDPQAVLLGWASNPARTAREADLQSLTRDWWERWVAPRGSYLAKVAASSPDLRSELQAILRSAQAEAPTDG